MEMRRLRKFIGVTLIAWGLIGWWVKPGWLEAQESGYDLSLSTYWGGADFEQARDVEIDDLGNIYVVGGTQSINFPRTLGSGFNSGSCPTLGSGGRMDVFVTKFSSTGQLVWSRLLGGPCYDRAYATEVDDQGNVYIGGRAGDNFPTTSGVVQPGFGGDSSPNGLYGQQDGFIAKFSGQGQLLWATYLGGNDKSFFRDIDLDAQGNVYGILTRSEEH